MNLFGPRQVIVNTPRNSPPHHIISTLVAQEHLMRDFLLPALWLVLESLREPHQDAIHLPGGPEVNVIHLVSEAAMRYISARTGSPGHAVMSALRAEVSPYWHLMNNAIQRAKPRDPAGATQQQALGRVWQQLGQALQLNSDRAPRQIEGPSPSTEQTCCSWPLCLYHSRKPPQALKSCKGCADAQYCGKQCQIR